MTPILKVQIIQGSQHFVLNKSPHSREACYGLRYHVNLLELWLDCKWSMLWQIIVPDYLYWWVSKLFRFFSFKLSFLPYSCGHMIWYFMMHQLKQPLSLFSKFDLARRWKEGKLGVRPTNSCLSSSFPDH